MMTRKDYVAVSDILRPYAEVMAEDYVEIARDFASYMSRDNPRFDTGRFLEACGVPKG
jgi:rhamnogalacturonyl hydrolase YesR